MKRETIESIFSACLAGAIGIFIGATAWHPEMAGAMPMPVSAIQQTSPSYNCNVGNGGSDPVADCVQYIVEVSSQRLGGGTYIYQVTSSPFAVNTGNISMVASGGVGNASTQQLIPNQTNTMTISVSKP